MSRAFRSLGFFLQEDVRKGFLAGQFMNGDYGRREDSSEWRPVEAIVADLARNGDSHHVRGSECGDDGKAPGRFFRFLKEVIDRF